MLHTFSFLLDTSKPLLWLLYSITEGGIFDAFVSHLSLELLNPNYYQHLVRKFHAGHPVSMNAGQL